eukprot:EG_transcript_7905
MAQPVQLWSIAQVTSWLASEGLGEFIPTFQKNQIDGMSLLQVTKQDLKDELEIPKLPDRKRVWAAIERLLGHGREAEADDSCASSPDPSLGYASSEASWSSVTKPNGAAAVSPLAAGAIATVTTVTEVRQSPTSASSPASPASTAPRSSPTSGGQRSPMAPQPDVTGASPSSLRSGVPQSPTPVAAAPPQPIQQPPQRSATSPPKPKIYPNGLPYPDVPVADIVLLNHPAAQPTTHDLIDEVRRETDALTHLMHELEGVHITELKYSPITSSPHEHPLGAHNVRGYLPPQAHARVEGSPELAGVRATYDPRSRMPGGKVDYRGLLQRQQQQQQALDVLALQHEEVMQRTGFR